jgi:hypothetical protein
MNDFTIEELEELYFFTELHKNKYSLKYPEELIKKLQSMIDNYCEHQIKLIGANPIDNEGICIYCGKCKAVIGDVY